MNSQVLVAGAGTCAESIRVVGSGRVVDLGRSGGRVRVLAGRVWITTAGGPEDHVLGEGETLRVPAARTLVETWGPTGSALIAWRAGTWQQRVARALRVGGKRCWELMSPSGRAALGAVAAAAALVAAGLLFGIAAESRTRTLATRFVQTPFPQNVGHAAAASARTIADADAGPSRERSRPAAQEAGRGTPGPA